MSDDYRRIELITGTARRRHWTTEQKLRTIEESFLPGETVSSVARRRGVVPNLLYRWRRAMKRSTLSRGARIRNGVWVTSRLSLAPQSSLVLVEGIQCLRITFRRVAPDLTLRKVLSM